MSEKNQNLINYDWYLSEIYEYFYVSRLSSPVISFQKEKKIIKNPNISQLWFFYLSKKNILMLQKMIDSNILPDLINTKDISDDTIVHKIQDKNLCSFALKNNADFSLLNIDNESGYYNLSYYFVPLSVFKMVWEKLSPLEVVLKLKETSYHMDYNILSNLCSNDKNFSKIYWLTKHFSIHLENFFEIPNYIEIAQKNKAQKNVFLLKNLFNLQKDLKKNLPIKNNKNSLIKI